MLLLRLPTKTTATRLELGGPRRHYYRSESRSGSWDDNNYARTLSIDRHKTECRVGHRGYSRSYQSSADGWLRSYTHGR